MKPRIIRHLSSAPPERVFAMASDFPNAASIVEGITGVEMLTGGPVRVGTQFRETRVMFGKPATETMEVVAFDPPRSYTLRAGSCGAEFVSEVRCVPDGAGTRLEIEMRCRPVSLFAKLMSPLSGLMMGSMTKLIAKDLADIARAAEGGERPASPGAGAAQVASGA